MTLGRKVKDWSGHAFRYLTVLDEHKFVGEKPCRAVYWLTKCVCGHQFWLRSDHIKGQKVVSCGCQKSRISRENNLRHGHSCKGKVSRTWRIWQGAKTRCYNPKFKDFHLYGGRGIQMSETWRNSFDAFLEDMGEAPENLTLDRIDPDGNYEAGNCRWATWSEQARNQRRYRCKA
jgi:hypothetical protein